MLLKTHLLVGLFFALLFLPTEDKFIFLAIVLISSIIPDIDSRFSKIGKKKTFRILQFFVRHRGIVHSFTLLLIVSFIFVFIYPNFILPFFLGYGSHLLIDGLTRQGIRPFYPLRFKIKGVIRTGRRFETLVFVIFLIVDLILVFERIFSVF